MEWACTIEHQGPVQGRNDRRCRASQVHRRVLKSISKGSRWFILGYETRSLSRWAVRNAAEPRIAPANSLKDLSGQPMPERTGPATGHCEEPRGKLDFHSITSPWTVFGGCGSSLDRGAKRLQLKVMLGFGLHPVRPQTRGANVADSSRPKRSHLISLDSTLLFGCQMQTRTLIRCPTRTSKKLAKEK